MLNRIGNTVSGWGAALNQLSRAHAEWEIETARTILTRRRKLLVVVSMPLLVMLALQAAHAAGLIPEKIPILGGSKAYMPAFATPTMLLGSIFVGLIAGLITGVIGAGGGYILTPALMSFGVRGIMAVGTDQFHLFAKAIMGTTIHKKLGNVNFGLAAWFVAGSLAGVTFGGRVNRSIFQHSPAASDALISTVYVIVLGILGLYAINDWLRQRRPGSNFTSTEATTDFARKLQAMKLRPQVAFDQDIVPGGRRISVYPVIFCGVVVGFTASIMGVGGGFLTFPMFVYGLGVSTFTTVGTDILQIIFTTSYSSIFQYAIYGFVFYTVSIGMLLGSLIGVQIGAMVTKMVVGSQIRAFYALTILAGFANRCCALPRKLADLGCISLSREASVAIEQAGTVIFFACVGIFALWILGVFARNAGAIRAKTVPKGSRVIADRKKLAIGVAGLVVFTGVLAAGICPIIGGRSALVRADNLFNELAKSSANYIPDARKQASGLVGSRVDFGVKPRDPVDEHEIVRLLSLNGAEAGIADEDRVRVTGDLGRLALAAAADARTAFGNDERSLEARYAMPGYESIYCWWVVFDGLTRRYVQEGRGKEADLAKFMSAKVLEPAYNFRGIRCCGIRSNASPAALLLAFYVLFTLWYGFSILYVFEGLGISTSAASEKREA